MKAYIEIQLDRLRQKSKQERSVLRIPVSEQRPSHSKDPLKKMPKERGVVVIDDTV